MRKSKRKIMAILLAAITMSIFSPCMITCASSLEVGAVDYILPNSDGMYYTKNDFAGMTAQQLCYGRNEIYAKHGRIFKSVELQEYFATKSWYQPQYSAEEFQDSWLSDAERANAELLLETEKEWYPGGYVLNQEGYRETWTNGTVGEKHIKKLCSTDTWLSMDLDGNGESEAVSVIFTEGEKYGRQEYSIYIGKSHAEGSGENIDPNIYGACLDGVNTYLVIFEYGPSDDPVCTFYQWDVHSGLTEIGKIPDNVDRIQINDDGTMDAVVRCNVLQTDTIRTKWCVDEDGYLMRMPQEIYEFDYSKGREYMLLQSVSVYKDPSFGSELQVLNPQTVTIPYTDGESWVYVQGMDGNDGWFYCDPEMTIGERMDVFDGLLFAD